jgi:hypothetical protein
MAITVSNAMTDSFKKEILMGTHLFKASSGNTFKMLMLKANASGSGTYGTSTTNVGTPGSGTPSSSNVGTDETSDSTFTTGGYSANGFTMTPNADPTIASNVAYVDWTTDPNWGSAATITACGAVLYNSSASGAVCATYTFSGDKTCTSGTFTITLPTPGAATAVLRIG